jgi:hypothetical protein
VSAQVLRALLDDAERHTASLFASKASHSLARAAAAVAAAGGGSSGPC